MYSFNAGGKSVKGKEIKVFDASGDAGDSFVSDISLNLCHSHARIYPSEYLLLSISLSRMYCLSTRADPHSFLFISVLPSNLHLSLYRHTSGQYEITSRQYYEIRNSKKQVD